MIISDSHKFIFVRTQKVGSTSILKMLATNLNQPSVYENNIPMMKIDGRLGHVSIEELLRDKEFDHVKDYFKFAVVRNPWDTLNSWYHYSKKSNVFKDMIENYATSPPFSIPKERIKIEIDLWDTIDEWYWDRNKWLGEDNWKIHTINDRPAMDYYLRYENLHNDLTTLSNKLNLPFDAGKEILNFDDNSGFRDNKWEPMSEEMLADIPVRFKKEIEFFKWEPPEVYRDFYHTNGF